MAPIDSLCCCRNMTDAGLTLMSLTLRYGHSCVRSCYLTPATPATPASYIKGTATDNLPWKNRLAKVCRNSAEFMKIARRICKLHTKNFQFFCRRILTSLVMLLYVPAVHLFQRCTLPHASLLQALNHIQ